MINRKLFKEERGQIIDMKGFRLVKGIDRLDVIGYSEYEGLYGFIRISQIENLIEAQKIFDKKKFIGKIVLDCN